MTQEYDYCDMIVSDLHKEAYGFRPDARWWNAWNNLTPDMKQAEWNRLSTLADEEAAREERLYDSRHEKWTAHLADLMSTNGIDYKTALRWDLDAMDCTGDYDQYCWLWSIRYTNAVDIKKIMED